MSYPVRILAMALLILTLTMAAAAATAIDMDAEAFFLSPPRITRTTTTTTTTALTTAMGQVPRRELLQIRTTLPLRRRRRRKRQRQRQRSPLFLFQPDISTTTTSSSPSSSSSFGGMSEEQYKEAGMVEEVTKGDEDDRVNFYDKVVHDGGSNPTDPSAAAAAAAPRPATTPRAPFPVLSALAARTLVRSDLRREECNDGASTGWTAWADESSASELRFAMGQVRLATCTAIAKELAVTQLDACHGEDEDEDEDEEQEQEKFNNEGDKERIRTEWLDPKDEVRRWTTWIKSTPVPMVVELSHDLRAEMNRSVTDDELRSIASTRSNFLNRAGCRLYLLPSGSTLRRPLRNPPGTMVYGSILYGGVTRFRLLRGGRHGKAPRRAGERTVIHDHGRREKKEGRGRKDGEDEAWLQYGGPERNYEAVDMGPCAFLELIILPIGLSLPPIAAPDCNDASNNDRDDLEDMTIDSMAWNSSIMFEFRSLADDADAANTGGSDGQCEASETHMEGEGRTGRAVLGPALTSSIGGLRAQVDAIVRRVLDGRAIRNGDGSSAEAAELAALGLTPVRGLLLYGPPGCGKTALAREISRALYAHPPKVVAAPELLDRWIGGSEKLVRSLFADAEEELRNCGGDASRSALHVIVIDEIDAVFRRRTASEDGGEATRASAVNQILSKLDGVEQIPNVLLIGMTNRRELLDEALLRPGRLEVQMEIPLPDQAGRREILQIHFDALRQRGRLSHPLCRAIDGWDTDKDIGRKGVRNRRPLFRALRYARDELLPRSGRRGQRRIRDLAEDGVTGGFSGADLAGLVRCAGSIALSRARRQGDGVDGLLITLDDVINALEEVKQ